MKSLFGWLLILANALFLAWNYLSVKSEAKRQDQTMLQSFRQWTLTWHLPGERRMIFAVDKEQGAQAGQVEGRLQFDDLRSEVYRTVLVEEARRAMEDCGTAVREAELWDREIVTLLQSGRGRVLARDEGFVREFDALYNKEREPVKVAQARWNAARIVFEKFEAGGFVETGSLFAEPNGNPFREMRAEARATIKSYQDARYRIEGMLDAARSLPGQSDKVTLLSAIEDVKRGKTLPRPATGCPAAEQTSVGCTGLSADDLKRVLLAARSAVEKKEVPKFMQQIAEATR